MNSSVTLGQHSHPSRIQTKMPVMHSTRLKVAGIAIGLLLAGLAVAFHFLHINALAVYTTSALGATLIIGAAVWMMIDRIRQSKNGAEGLKNKKNQEKIEWFKKVGQGKTKEIERVLGKGLKIADLNAMLVIAVQNGHTDMIKLLINKGADPQRDDGDRHLLHRALQLRFQNFDKTIEIVQILLDNFPSLVNVTMESVSPLHVACNCSHIPKDKGHKVIKLVQLLMSKGADVGAQDSKYNTPLHVVAQGGLGAMPPQVEMIKLLINYGVNLNVTNDDGKLAANIAQEKYPDWFRVHQEVF